MAPAERAPGRPPGPAVRYLVRQFGRPAGPVGRLAGWFMAHRPSNRRRNEWTVDTLAIEPAHNVLELGFGPGYALARASARAREGVVVGIDHSTEMCRAAGRVNRQLVESGRLRLIEADAEALDAAFDSGWDGFFDRAYAVNVTMFWREPQAVLRQLRRLLAPGGRLALTWQPRVGEKTERASLESAEKIRGWLVAAGFDSVCVELLREVSPPAVCVIGERPALGQQR